MTEPEEKILAKVQKLLNLANHPNTGESERDAFLSKADSLMTDHAISEAHLAAAQTPEQRRAPVDERLKMWDSSSEYGTLMEQIFHYVAIASRVKFVNHYPGSDVTLVGYHDDVEYCKMLFMGIQFGFSAKLNPTWDRSLGFNANVYALKEAGIKWESIKDIANSNLEYVAWPDGGRLIRAYKAQCIMLRISPTPHTQRNAAYRNTFAQHFRHRICERLQANYEVGREHVDSTPGAALVLAGGAAEVDERLYVLFPDRRPLTAEAKVARRLRWEKDHERMLEAQRLEELEDGKYLAGLSPAARRSVLTERRRRENAADRIEDRWLRQQDRARVASHDDAGAAKGRAAADSVSLGRTSAVDGKTNAELQ